MLWLAGALDASRASAADGSLTAQDTISGRDLQAIEAVLPLFRAKGLDISQYAVTVLNEGSIVTVLFDDPERSSGQRGSGPRLRAFAVRLRADNFSVIDGTFQR
jgi:hypothetical protein